MIELHRRHLGCETWDVMYITGAMTAKEYDTKSCDKAQSWSLFDTEKSRRVMISKITYERQDPSDPEIQILLGQQAQRLAFLQSHPAPHVPELENWRKPGTRRVTKAPAPCRPWGQR